MRVLLRAFQLRRLLLGHREPAAELRGRSSGVIVAAFQRPCRSGWPHGVRGVFAVGRCAARIAGIAAAINAAPARRKRELRIMKTAFQRLRTYTVRLTDLHVRRGRTRRSPRQRGLTPLAVHQLLDELDALEFHQLRVPLDPAIQREADLPRLGERVRILDGRFVHRM